jgi:DNA-binding transcriptional MerR regulator
MKNLDFNKLSKLYYSIGEVAEMFDVSKSLIRYWETEFSFLNPKKNNKGDRRFTKENIKQLLIIYTLVKERGFTLEGAKHEIKLNKKSLQAGQDLLTHLKKLKERISLLRSDLDNQ